MSAPFTQEQLELLNRRQEQMFLGKHPGHMTDAELKEQVDLFWTFLGSDFYLWLGYNQATKFAIETVRKDKERAAQLTKIIDSYAGSNNQIATALTTDRSQVYNEITKNTQVIREEVGKYLVDRLLTKLVG
jgi:hypothetical protein